MMDREEFRRATREFMQQVAAENPIPEKYRHLPEPWAIATYFDGDVPLEQGKPVRAIFGNGDIAYIANACHKSSEEHDKNMRLILAAPMLLRALTYAQEGLEEYVGLLRSMKAECLSDYEFLLSFVEDVLEEATEVK